MVQWILFMICILSTRIGPIGMQTRLIRLFMFVVRGIPLCSNEYSDRCLSVGRPLQTMHVLKDC